MSYHSLAIFVLKLFVGELSELDHHIHYRSVTGDASYNWNSEFCQTTNVI